MRAIQLLLILTIITGYGNKAVGQEEFVVLISGDTIQGDVDSLSSINSCKKVVIRLPDSTKRRIRPRGALEYFRLDRQGSVHYVVIEVDRPIALSDQRKFVKVLESGTAELLEFQYRKTAYMGQSDGPDGQPIYFNYLEVGADTTNFGLVYDQVDYYLILKDDTTRIEREGFPLKMSQTLTDNKLLSEAIRRGEFSFNDLQLIVKMYNGTVPLKAGIEGFDIGYLQLEGGAKIYGNLKNLSSLESCKKVVFIDESGVPKLVKREIIELYKRGKEVYIKQPILSYGFGTVDSSAFMKRMCNGFYDLLKYTTSSFDKPVEIGSRGQGQTNQNKSRTKFFLSRNDTLIEVRKRKFRKDAIQYFSDHPLLPYQILNRIARFEHLVEIVEEYNRFKASE